MKKEEKLSKTELILMNNRTRNIGTNIFNLKKINNTKFHNNHKIFAKTDNNLLNTNNKEKKYKMFGTQTISFGEKNINKKINIKNKKRKVLLSEIKDLCDNMYETRNYTNNNFRIKLEEDIIKSIDNYIFSDLRKNILFPKIFRLKTDRRIKIHKFGFLKKKEKIKEKSEKKEIRENSLDSNKVSMKDILNSDNNNSNLKYRRIKVYKYGDYAKNNIKYNHPRIYTLRNTYRIKDMFPRIKPFDTLNEFHDFTKLIPEKKTNNKEFNKQIYKAYKTMKIKNKKQRVLLNVN